MLMIALLVIVGATLCYFYLVKHYRYWTDRGVKQGNPKILFGDNFGNALKKQSSADLVQMVYNQCQGVRYSGMYQFLVPTLLIKDRELIKQITVKDFDHFTDHRTFIPEDADPLWGKNLFALTVQKWRDMRAILSPSFTSSKMRAMFVLMTECAENFVQHFLNKKEDVITVEFKDTFTRFTNDVIATTAFGIKVDSLGEPKNQFYMMGKEATDLTSFWKNLQFLLIFLIPKLYKVVTIKLFSKEVSNFFGSVVKDTIKMREEKGIVRPDMINLLVEARKGIQRQDENGVIDTGFSTAEDTFVVSGKAKQPKEISDLDIAAQAMIFFFAGFDSVSGLMCFLAYELATNPEVQDKLRKEVKSTMEECNGKVTYDALLKMKYMDMVLSEVLRKWPIAVAVDRICTKPYTIESVNSEERPVHLKHGDVLWLPIYAIHHDPEYFPDPERFDPERFNDENKNNIKPYSYFPFGLGPRNCIGSRFALLETKTVFFYILNSFELVPVGKSIIPLRISKKQFNLSSEDGFWFGLKRVTN